jgi:hypothetical protein
MLVTMTLGMSPIGGDGANRTASHMTLFMPIMREEVTEYDVIRVPSISLNLLSLLKSIDKILDRL